MKPPVPHLRLANGLLLREKKIRIGDLHISGSAIDDVSPMQAPCLDVSGYMVLPGIIDLHGDAFEHHIAPRPTAPFPLEMGLAGTDRDAAANGITTAWLAQSWSWEGGHRSPEFAERLLEAHATYRHAALTDFRVQLRCETYTVETEARLVAAVEKYGIDYVIFNNHLDEAIEMAKLHPDRISQWAEKSGLTVEEHMALVRRTEAQRSRVPRYLGNLATAFDALGVRYGSHDDPSAAVRERFSMIGAKICEFPTAFGAAAVARLWGDPILMGAPNVVRGGSQSGNISAVSLIDHGLCTALVSDYYYPSLYKAAFMLADRGMPFAEAWAMVSTNPARVMGLSDRGSLVPGQRADIAIVNTQTRLIEGTMSAGRWSYLAGKLAGRLNQAAGSAAFAAE